MKTLLICGATGPPAPVRDIIERGSTAVVYRPVHEAPLHTVLETDADRVVFWRGDGDAAIGTLAEAYAARQPSQARDHLLFVTAEAPDALPRLPSDQLFFWPRDEDRLKMAFMTGA